MRFFAPRQVFLGNIQRAFSTSLLALAARNSGAKAIQWADVTQPLWGLPAEDYYTKLYFKDAQFKSAQEKGYLSLEMYARISREQRDHLAWFFHCIPNAMTVLDQHYLTLPEYLLCRRHICFDLIAIFNSDFFHAVIETKKIVIRDLISDNPDETEANLEKLVALKNAFLARHTQEAIKRGYITLDAMISLNAIQLNTFCKLMSRDDYRLTPMDLIDKRIFSLEIVLNSDANLQEKYARHIRNSKNPVSIEKFVSLRPHTQMKLSNGYSPCEEMTIDQFDQLSDEDQSDLWEFLALYIPFVPISALLALPHETRLLFADLSQADDGRGGTTNLDYRIAYKFLAELSLHKPEKLAEFKALSFSEQKACFDHLDRYENAWYSAGKGDLSPEPIIPEKSCAPTMGGMH